jgi:hypothetical protein
MIYSNISRTPFRGQGAKKQRNNGIFFMKKDWNFGIDK